ncbi:MAG: hypothetical protein J0H29_16390 [Sphingobacteriales bacterium]|nr:hypothetical protein [Sphingobacteriales bacterium]OJY91852.1 MAG: hypothetical protein BGP14_23260 [Sphingobacteriales bacterium 44-15]
MKDSRKFYKALGDLFYAVAAADHIVRAEEREQLDNEIQFAWKHYDNSTDRFGSDRAFLTEFEFEAMEDNMTPAEEAYEAFEAYFSDHQQEIDTHTRIRIFNSARHIAEAIRKLNKEETKYLVRLKHLLSV